MIPRKSGPSKVFNIFLDKEYSFFRELKRQKVCIVLSPSTILLYRKFLPLEANQILEAALSWGVFGNLEFETLLISSFLVIQSKDVCPSRA